MSLIKKSAAGLVLTAAAAATSAAFAAGFQLTEQSSLGLGRAYAGAGIVGDDLSAVHYNPAGMTLLPGTRMQAGGVWIAVDAPFKGKDGSEENGRLKGQMIPTGYITHQVNDQLWLGFGMTVPFGMGTEYSDDWSEKQRGTDSMILTFDMNPSFAYKMSDFISFGGGISVQYAKAKLGMGLYPEDKYALLPNVAAYVGHGEVEADSWSWGYNLGVMISPNDKMRFGLAYRSSIEHNADGEFRFSDGQQLNLPGHNLNAALLNGFVFDTEATIETPDTVMLTGTWEATDKLRLSGLIRWANWSNFKSLKIENSIPATVAGMGGSALSKKEITNNWEDTWLFSVGADYKLNNSWTVRGGIAYEMDPIDDQSTRMAVIPDTDRLWLTLGSTYKYNDDLQFDVGAAYLKGIGDKDLYSHQGAGAIKVGEYDKLDCYMVGVQMQYRF